MNIKNKMKTKKRKIYKNKSSKIYKNKSSKIYKNKSSKIYKNKSSKIYENNLINNIVVNNNYNFNEKDIKKKGINNISKLIHKLLNENKIIYPFKKYNIDEQEIKDRFKRLSNYKYKLIHKPYKHKNKFNLPKHFLKYKGRPTILLFKYSNYFNYDLISDYFQEKK